MKVLADEKEEIIYTVPKYQHCIAVWIKFDTFYFQIFCKKEEIYWPEENFHLLQLNKLETK